MADHKEIAEQLLAASDIWIHAGVAPDGRPAAWPSYLTHAILALCERLDERALEVICDPDEEADPDTE